MLSIPKNLRSTYSGKRILVTGHSGFKGKWLVLLLRQLGADVLGISNENESVNDASGFVFDDNVTEVIADLISAENYIKALEEFDPQYVFYFAAQSLVRTAYNDPTLTMSSNVMGLTVFLNSVRSLKSLKTILIATTDKVYDPTHKTGNFRERDILGGTEPYSCSKVMQEQLAKCFFHSYFYDTGVNMVTVRAGNVIGGADFSDDRLLVDIYKAVKSGVPMGVRYPHNTRPWQYVIDLLIGYICLVHKLSKRDNLFDNFNFAPDVSHSVDQILEFAKDFWGGRFDFNVLDAETSIKEQKDLSINSDKVTDYLGWDASVDLKSVLAKTFSWYQAFDAGENMKLFNETIIEKQLNE